jgi:hypothetical protein
VSFTGTISSLSGSCPVLRFTAGGRTVLTDTNTRFNMGNCQSLRNGSDVEIEGEQQSAGTVLANRVRIVR